MQYQLTISEKNITKLDGHYNSNDYYASANMWKKAPIAESG